MESDSSTEAKEINDAVKKAVEGQDLTTIGKPLETAKPDDKKKKLYGIKPDGYNNTPTETKKLYSQLPNIEYKLVASLLTPLVIGSIWLSYVLIVNRVIPRMEQLSPSASNTLVGILFGFVISYAIFLIIYLCKKKSRIVAS